MSSVIAHGALLMLFLNIRDSTSVTVLRTLTERRLVLH